MNVDDAALSAMRSAHATNKRLHEQVGELKLEIENLKMVCRRLAAAKTIESKDRIAAQCFELFKGSPLRASL